MRLTQKKAEEIILTLLGEEGIFLIKELFGKENISEFDLAKKTNKDIKVIRKMLYFLYNYNLVGFIRKKDKEKGWYIYYWTLLPDNVRFIYFKKRKELLERLKNKLEEESKELFFICPGECVRLNFDNAMDLDFHCPECGELLNQDDSKDRINFLKKKINEIEEELAKYRAMKKAKKIATQARKKVVLQKVKTKKKKIVKRKVVKKKDVKQKVVKKKVTSFKKSVKKPTTKKITSKKSIKKPVIKKSKTIKRKRIIKAKKKTVKSKKKAVKIKKTSIKTIKKILKLKKKINN